MEFFILFLDPLNLLVPNLDLALEEEYPSGQLFDLYVILFFDDDKLPLQRCDIVVAPFHLAQLVLNFFL